MGRKERELTQTTAILSERLDDLVKEKQKACGLNQKNIAKEIGVSSGSLSNWCSDGKSVTAENIIKIAKYFNVSTDYLLGLTDNRSTEESIKVACKTTGLSELAIRQLQDRTWNKFPERLNIISRLIISPNFSEFLDAVYHYHLLADGEFSPEEQEIRDLVYENQMYAMKYIEDNECSPLTIAFLALKSNLNNRDISKFYLQSAQEEIKYTVEHLYDSCTTK